MDWTTNGIVAGLFGIITPIITFIATKAYERRFLDPISNSRRAALSGNWRGQLRQDEEGPDRRPFEATITIDLKAARKIVEGYAFYDAIREEPEFFAKFSVTGILLHDQYLKLDYKNTKSTSLWFGSMLLRLSSDGRSLDGRFFGYGALAERLVFGSLHLQKVS